MIAALICVFGFAIGGATIGGDTGGAGGVTTGGSGGVTGGAGDVTGASGGVGLGFGVTGTTRTSADGGRMPHEGEMALGYHFFTAESTAKASIALARLGDASLHLLIATGSVARAASEGIPTS